ncbi:MAG: hypothetical protein M3481_07895 [Actinomycetota bacterium]|nr:hypothetical protein [Actinomycetota bacterium]
MSGEGGGGHGESTGAIAAAFLANLGIAVGGDQLAGGRVRDLRRGDRLRGLRAAHRRPPRDARASRTRLGVLRPYVPQPELPVLLLEDSGALIGLIFATAGVALAIVTGNPLFDGLGMLAIGILLVASRSSWPSR